MVNHNPPFTLKCHAWATVSEIKKELEKTLKVTHSNLRLFFKNIELTKNGVSLLDYDVKSYDTLTVKITPHLQNSLGVINPYRIFDKTPESICRVIEDIKSGFHNGIKPKLADSGTSGSYFLENHNFKTVAIFKPYDEEPFAPNNPRSFLGELGSQGFRKGILSGESAAREVAAFLLDGEGFHGVPPTTYVEFYHPSFSNREYCENVPVKSTREFKLKNEEKTKHGSLQGFVAHDDSIGNYGSNCFSVEEVHKIAILDIRILNCDRNDENVLVKKHNVQIETSHGMKTKKEYNLIPIDHGLSFPDNFEIYDYEIVWINFPQCIQPFTEKELKFIQSIDPAMDCEGLRERLEFRPICLRNFRIAQILLKKAAAMGFNLYDISQILYRSEPMSDESDKESSKGRYKAPLSELEKLVVEAENIYAIVKKNGLKSTVYYQIGIIRPRGPYHTRQIPLISIKEEDDNEDESRRVSSRQIPLSVLKHVKRGLSLPYLKVGSEFD